ncbi:hypothetical protein K438DRAFT_1968000 [Mycena galopus ATCC 62051]|nr:hypothetical protein K438DRAFT_1968000 [Mycena galopus ATCC 62051]
MALECAVRPSGERFACAPFLLAFFPSPIATQVLSMNADAEAIESAPKLAYLPTQAREAQFLVGSLPLRRRAEEMARLLRQRDYTFGLDRLSTAGAITRERRTAHAVRNSLALAPILKRIARGYSPACLWPPWCPSTPATQLTRTRTDKHGPEGDAIILSVVHNFPEGRWARLAAHLLPVSFHIMLSLSLPLLPNTSPYTQVPFLLPIRPIVSHVLVSRPLRAQRVRALPPNVKPAFAGPDAGGHSGLRGLMSSLTFHSATFASHPFPHIVLPFFPLPSLSPPPLDSAAHPPLVRVLPRSLAAISPDSLPPPPRSSPHPTPLHLFSSLSLASLP